MAEEKKDFLNGLSADWQKQEIILWRVLTPFSADIPA